MSIEHLNIFHEMYIGIDIEKEKKENYVYQNTKRKLRESSSRWDLSIINCDREKNKKDAYCPQVSDSNVNT